MRDPKQPPRAMRIHPSLWALKWSSERGLPFMVMDRSPWALDDAAWRDGIAVANGELTSCLCLSVVPMAADQRHAFDHAVL